MNTQLNITVNEIRVYLTQSCDPNIALADEVLVCGNSYEELILKLDQYLSNNNGQIVEVDTNESDGVYIKIDLPMIVLECKLKGDLSEENISALKKRG